MLWLTQNTYRRAVWSNQSSYVEVWLEKDALAGVLYGVTSEWDVPLMVTRGFPSIRFLHSAAGAIASLDCPVFLYYFGDRDPSGIAIDRTVQSIAEMAPKSDFNFQRVAMTPEQIEEFNLPTRPTKQSDSRSKNFRGESVEVDAIEPDALRRLAEECIIQHIDQHALNQLRATENAERQTLQTISESLDGGKYE